MTSEPYHRLFRADLLDRVRRGSKSETWDDGKDDSASWILGAVM